MIQPETKVSEEAVEVYGARNDTNWTSMARTFITLAIGLVGVVLIAPIKRGIVSLYSNVGMIWHLTQRTLNLKRHGNAELSVRSFNLTKCGESIQCLPLWGKDVLHSLRENGDVYDYIVYSEKSTCLPEFLVARAAGCSP